MNRRHRLDDRAAEALLSGRAVDGEPELGAFVAGAQAMVADAAPAPSADLAQLLEQGLPASAVAPAAVLPRRQPVSIASLSWGRAGVALTGAVAALLTAATANALPAPAQNAVARVVSWVTAVELPRAPHHALTPKPAPTERPSPSKAPTPPRTEDGQDGTSDGHDSPAPERSTDTSDGGSRSGEHDSPEPNRSAEPSDSGSGGDSNSGPENSGPESSSPESDDSSPGD